MPKKKSKRRMTGEAVIFDAAGRVLLVKQGEKGRGWELPGGKVKKQESLPDAVVREVQEEAGVEVIAEQLLGVFYIPTENTYDFVVRCRLVQNDVKPKANPPETVEAKFFAVDSLPKKISAFTIDRISDALEGNVHSLPVELTRKQWLG